MCSPLLQITAHPLPLLLLPGQVALCKLACIGHNHTQLRSSVLALMPLLLRCLIEPAQLFAPPLLNNLTCCFQMHSALRPLLWGWCAGLTDAINKVIHYNFLLFYLNYTTRLLLSHSAHQHWFGIIEILLYCINAAGSSSQKPTHIKNIKNCLAQTTALIRNFPLFCGSWYLISDPVVVSDPDSSHYFEISHFGAALISVFAELQHLLAFRGFWYQSAPLIIPTLSQKSGKDSSS